MDAQNQDWRAEALRRMELDGQLTAGVASARETNGHATVVFMGKIFLLLLLSGAIFFIAGWGMIPAVALAAWLLFWK